MNGVTTNVWPPECALWKQKIVHDCIVTKFLWLALLTMIHNISYVFFIWWTFLPYSLFDISAVYSTKPTFPGRVMASSSVTWRRHRFVIYNNSLCFSVFAGFECTKYLWCWSRFEWPFMLYDNRLGQRFSQRHHDIGKMTFHFALKICGCILRAAVLLL
jgi:hypothetical protein